jgi:pyruvate dehydrogenase E2 component (dihydrolipoamide acetyltransferase)
MEAGTVLEWRVKPGDAVHRGDIVAVVDTDKADIDVEIFESGVIEELLVPVGERVPVGTPLARVASPDRVGTGGRIPPPAPRSSKTDLLAPPPRITTEPCLERPGTVPVRHNGHELVSPVLRRLAAHLGVDVDTVAGTGSLGRVTRDDIEAAAKCPETSEPLAETPESSVPVAETPEGSVAVIVSDRPRDRRDAQRQAIASLMARSKREIPHYYVATEIDLSSALQWLESTNAAHSVSERVLPAAVLLSAVAHTASELPEFNGFWKDGRFEAGAGVHLGLAVSLREGGLVAPAIHDADRLGLPEFMVALRDVVQRARSGRLRSSEMADATITVTNLGERGVEVVHGVIYPPQVALVGLGRIVDRPWAEHGMVGVRPIVTATLAADHRATDGHQGAAFLGTLDRLLQHPEKL